MLYALSYKRLFILEKEILEVERVMVRDRETDNQQPSTVNSKDGGLAQLARAPALHAGGHRFDSDILHQFSCWLIVVSCWIFSDNHQPTTINQIKVH